MRANEFDTEDLANTAWAYAKAGQFDAPMFSALAVVAQRRASEFNTQDFASIAWAFEKEYGQARPMLFEAWAKEADRRMTKSDPISAEWAEISRSQVAQTRTAVAPFLFAKFPEVISSYFTSVSVLTGLVAGSGIALVVIHFTRFERLGHAREEPFLA